MVLYIYLGAEMFAKVAKGKNEMKNKGIIETRKYPSCCTSLYCGKIECPADCANLPVLEGFKNWVSETNAKVADPIWCPGFYEGIRKDVIK